MVARLPFAATFSASVFVYNPSSNTSLYVLMCILHVFYTCRFLQATPAPVFLESSFDLSVQNETSPSPSLSFSDSSAVPLASQGKSWTLPRNLSFPTHSVLSVPVSAIITVTSTIVLASYCSNVFFFPPVVSSRCHTPAAHPVAADSRPFLVIQGECLGLVASIQPPAVGIRTSNVDCSGEMVLALCPPRVRLLRLVSTPTFL